MLLQYLNHGKIFIKTVWVTNGFVKHGRKLALPLFIKKVISGLWTTISPSRCYLFVVLFWKKKKTYLVNCLLYIWIIYNLSSNQQLGLLCTPLLAITNDICEALVTNPSLDVFLDLSKVFDKIWHARIM